MKATFYTNRDNYYTLSCTLNGSAFSLTAATDIELKHHKGSIKRSVSPAVFEADGGNVRLNLGEAGLEAGTYPTHIIIYTKSWPNGMVWGKADLTVVAV